MSNELRIGVIGAGRMGTRHAQCWAKLPGVSVTAIADILPDKAGALADKVGSDDSAQAFDSVETLIAAGGVDAVSVCVPTDAHREVSEAALRAGIHVFCEKPLALTVEDCDAMIAAAKAGNVLLSVGQIVRFFPEYAQAKRLVDAGSVGQAAAVRTRRGGTCPTSEGDWFTDVSRSGGIILDLLVHDIDWLQWCFGPIRRVYARGLTERLAEGSLRHLDYALLTMRHESGVISHVEGTWADPHGWATTFEIAGDAGLLHHDSRRVTTISRAVRQDEDGFSPGAVAPASPLIPDDDPCLLEIAAFARAVRDGAPLAVTAEEARSAVAVAVAARESIRTGNTVTVGAEG